ncbi:MAG: hypothetical protein ACD_51C00167G0001 [uncultured bacterium]|nr:MAG: hypothetical protein ACD_51C00167G0001 [uncultured bacterium]
MPAEIKSIILTRNGPVRRLSLFLLVLGTKQTGGWKELLGISIEQRLCSNMGSPPAKAGKKVYWPGRVLLSMPEHI